MLSKNQQKFISSLAIKKFREETGFYIAEGEKPVDELLIGCHEVTELFAVAGWLDAARQLLIKDKKAVFHEISEPELKKISQLNAPNKVLALVKIPKPQILIPEVGYYLALDRVNDPGNLGTIIRICDWFAVKGLICSPGTVDPYNPKVVQASMGSLFRVPLFQKDLVETVNTFRSLNIPVYAAVLGGTPLGKTTFTGSGLIVMGSESHGVDRNLIELTGNTITIEKKGVAESLNVAVAAGIICSRLS